ncbi:MAG TPA: preprotein translocase subunit YajC [Prevotellaceae bacterium]|nr:preprotein translocase subunit YajC [Prevotellaceae bacterium]
MITVLAQVSPWQQYQPLIMLGLIIVIMWFFIFRPQQKKQKEIQNFRNAIKEGQQVVTAGGIYGTVKKIMEEDNALQIEVSKGMCIKVDRNSVYATAQPAAR